MKSGIIFLDADLSVVDGSDFLLRYLGDFPKMVMTVAGKHDSQKDKDGIWLPSTVD